MKATLRIRMRALSLAVEAHDRVEASKGVSVALLSYIDQHLKGLKSTGIAIFRSFADEVDLSVLEKEISNREIPYQVLKNSDALQLDHARLIIVPGVAFDAFGNRLGRGKGYYDRLLSRLRSHSLDVVAIGVGYDHQLVDRVPTEPHDAFLDFVCTPSLGLVPSKLEKN